MNQLQNQSVPCVSLLEQMRLCDQMPGLSVLAHGEMVEARYLELIGHIRDGAPLTSEWRMPEWIYDPIILKRLLPDDMMRTYLRYHDAGKITTRTVDEDGRVRFPGHAEASRDIWLAIGGDPEVAELMALDMEIHLLKDIGVEAFAKRPQAIALLLAGLSEVHANAGLFGGLESDSAKAKIKNIDRRGKAILKRLAA
ncbi:hypothetical protein [Bosea sp. ANAM02]|uniref:hypothetical protein n=1 Tax=Bosea sp. ANAM02 TaxID=2020412 RepID=UPI001FCEE018|nr:hypothetical protein [Bosea sp. ANAM02]